MDVSKILIKFGTLPRLFELFGCTMLDSVSVVANPLAECTFLRRSPCFYEGLGPRGAKVTQTLTLEHGMSEYPQIFSVFSGSLRDLLGSFISSWGKLQLIKNAFEVFWWSDSKLLSQVASTQYKVSL